MYYSNGNFEAFARPRKPEGVDNKTAHIVGGGIAGCAAAAFLIRDAQMDPRKITIYEATDIAGGCLDGIKDPIRGFIFRGERELEDHYECLWDLMRSIPSLDVEGASVTDDTFYITKDRPNFSLNRITEKQGQSLPTDGQMLMNPQATQDMMKLFFTRNEDLYDKTFSEVVSKDLFDTNFWIYWQSMFAVVPWHGALEMKLYANRFIHKFQGFSDLSACIFTRLNQFDSLVLPLVKYLEQKGVKFVYNTRVTNVKFDIKAQRKVAKGIEYLRGGKRGKVDVGEDDLVLITIGSPVENTSWGDHHTPAKWDKEIREGSIWALWRNIAAQDPSFGRPDKFCTNHDHSSYESACVQIKSKKVASYIEKICKRDPYLFDGNIVTGGLVVVKDSNWFMNWNIERNPHFRNQPKDLLLSHIYGAFSLDRPGNYVKKPMKDCTGEEIAQEWMYHMGVPLAEIPELAANGVVCYPCMMPYITAFFLPRRAGDRPDVVPEGAVNFAFLGQFAESNPRDVIFTVEYSVRTAMEAVYTLLDIERGVPEPWASQYDIRVLLNAMAVMRDGKKMSLSEILTQFPAMVQDQGPPSDLKELFRQYGLMGELGDPKLLSQAMRKDPPRCKTVIYPRARYKPAIRGRVKAEGTE